MLRFRRWLVLKLFESSSDVPWHGEVHLLFDVVPIKGDANVACARPVCCDFVMVFERLFEMERVFFAYVFDAKVVDN